MHLDHQRGGKAAPAGGSGRGAGDDCTLGCRGFCCCWMETCWGGGVYDIFCLMSSPTACSVAMFWAICSWLALSSSTLRRTTSRLDAKDSSCCAEAEGVVAT